MLGVDVGVAVVYNNVKEGVTVGNMVQFLNGSD